MIKFLDIYQQDKSLHKYIISDIKKSFKNTDFINGRAVKEFENLFAKFCKTNYAIGCSNGTDALTAALKSFNFPANSEVIIPAMTYCSTAFSVINAGLKPVLVDLKENTPTIDVNLIKKKISKKTKVIMPVHLYGSVAEIDKIKNLIKGRNIYLIDDCAQAHGAFENGNKSNKRRVGSLSDISCFSLYPGKNLGAYGDAGVITTNNKIYYKRIKKIVNLGSSKKFSHELVGMNNRLDTLQAIVLKHKLKKLDSLNKKRIEIAKYYNLFIKNNKIEKLLYSENSVYHQYVILVKRRKKLINAFEKNKVQYGFHYPRALNQIVSLKRYFKYEKYPNAQKIALQGLSLPINPLLKKKDIIKICDLINSH